MNQFDGQADQDTRFDRLVDGEMSDAERRQLLASLDDEPGGWRRCALAFLEAQAWRQGMPEVVRGIDLAAAAPALDDPAGAPCTPAPSGRSDRRSLVGLALAMAACFLVTFFAGTEVWQRLFPPATPDVPVTQQDSSGTREFAGPLAEPSPVASAAGTTPNSDDLPTPSGEVPWGAATLVMDDSAGREIDVPVFDLDPYSRQVLLETSTASLDNLRDEFRRRGFDVRRDVRWPSIEVAPGQRMVLPVGDFEITPISGRAIQ